MKTIKPSYEVCNQAQRLTNGLIEYGKDRTFTLTERMFLHEALILLLSLHLENENDTNEHLRTMHDQALQMKEETINK